ncbi:MAG TPA: hypothetical protein VM841_12155 [Actinomycetota bacterium]|nr:hypothetical protein [Actinomycetota bacterium]
MQPRKDNQKRITATHAMHDSLDATEAHHEIDLKMVEALQRIERVRSKALAALGTLISSG